MLIARLSAHRAAAMRDEDLLGLGLRRVCEQAARLALRRLRQARAGSAAARRCQVIAASAARADLAVAHEALSALDVPASPSVASRVRALAQRTLEAEALCSAQAAEIAKLKSALEDATRRSRWTFGAHQGLLAQLEAEARGAR